MSIFVVLLVFGTEQLRKMPVDVFPEFAPPKVEIQTEGLGMTASQVEELITIPMEDALRGTPNIDVIRSSSLEETLRPCLFMNALLLTHNSQLVQVINEFLLRGLMKCAGSLLGA